MRIETEKIKVELDIEEANDIAFALKNSIENSIDNHWLNYPNVFLEREGKKIRLAEELFASIGLYHVAVNLKEDLINRLNNLVEKKK